MGMPPNKEGFKQSTSAFDATVDKGRSDKEQNPIIFVIFNDNQAYLNVLSP